MKIQKTVFFFLILFVLTSCSKKPNNQSENNLPNNTQSKLLSHIPMPANLDSAMRQSFVAETYKILKKLNPKNVKSYTISKENYLKMIDHFPANADRVAFSFVRFDKEKYLNKYSELAKYDDCLYLVYFYMDANGNNIGNKAYAMLGIQNTLEIIGADYQSMTADYRTNIKPDIDKIVKGPQGNTRTVKIKKDELLEYKNRILSKPNAKKFKITLAQWVDYNVFAKRELSAVWKRLQQFSGNSVGQMTFITDCQDNNGNNINDLSGGDINSTCPNQCSTDE